jgi:hypothetical protein
MAQMFLQRKDGGEKMDTPSTIIDAGGGGIELQAVPIAVEISQANL